MNIFPIHLNPKICAQWSCDQHIVKILTEAVEIYSSALAYTYPKIWNKLDWKQKYKIIKSPIVKWAYNPVNRIWLCFYIYELNREYEYRYGKKHKAYEVFLSLANVVKEVPYTHIQIQFPETFPQVVPEYLKQSDPIKAYRDYYCYKYKQGFKKPMRWTKRNIPEFLK